MGIVGRWIDSLPEGGAERDAIITHPDPTYDGYAWWSEEHDCGCLVGCVVAVSRTKYAQWSDCNCKDCSSSPRNHAWGSVGQRFPELTERFTAERMWRLVKARAARNHAPPLTTAVVEHREHAKV